jgi:ubiquitin-conjugating enzyme E2 S
MTLVFYPVLVFHPSTLIFTYYAKYVGMTISSLTVSNLLSFESMATENLAPQVITRLMGEIRQLVRSKSEGIEYIQDEDEKGLVSEVHALITGPEGTPYSGGNFRMKLVLGQEYPNVPPRGFFLTKIYHPNVGPTGDICVNTLKKDWSSETTLKHVLQVIRCLLIVPFPESSLNDEAGKLFMESYDEFARRAKMMTEVHAMTVVDKEMEGCIEKNTTTTSSDKLSKTSEKTDKTKVKAKEAKKKSMKRL